MKIKQTLKKYDKLTFIKKCEKTLIIEGLYTHIIPLLETFLNTTNTEIDHQTETAYITNNDKTLILQQLQTTIPLTQLTTL